MKTKFTLSIKKRPQSGWLILLIVAMPLLLGVLNEFLGLPWTIRYLLDGAWLGLLLFAIFFQRHVCWKPAQGVLGWICLFLAYSLAVYVVEYQSVLYFLWGVRNNFRFYVVLLTFALFLTSKDIEEYLKWFDKLFWINFVLSLIQYFVQGIKGDYLGGLFGTGSGVNGCTNSFFVLMVAKSLLLYLQKKEKTWNCISKCVAALIVAALAELKFFFAEFALILALAVLFTDFTWRKLWVILGGMVAVVGCAALLVVIFPHFEGFFSLTWLYDAATSTHGYTSSGDLNRLKAIPQVNELWLKTWSQRLFGLGLGNCDTSGFSIVNTPFYEANGSMHYNWMSYVFMYLECGWIGLIFYFGFFVFAYIKGSQVCKYAKGNERVYCLLARITAICCVVISVYNATLRTETGYMMYFVLSIPYVIEREHTIRKRREHFAEKLAAQNSVQGEGII